jgi:ribosome-associated protein
VSESPILQITDDLFLPRAELVYRASRAGGPGGQHVNTSSTRVELVWSVAESPA